MSTCLDHFLGKFKKKKTNPFILCALSELSAKSKFEHYLVNDRSYLELNNL